MFVLPAACSLSTSGLSPVGADASVDSSRDAQPEVASHDAISEVVSPDAEEDSGPDASEAASACNAQSCGGACCGDTCTVRSCAGCGVGVLFCPFAPGAGSNGYCVSDCAHCVVGGNAFGSACWSCAGGSPIGVCTSDPTTCPADVHSGACGCTAGDSNMCPGPTQVCVGSSCLTCGQPGTDGILCSNGEVCAMQSRLCVP
jgi:hypothetical protein